MQYLSRFEDKIKRIEFLCNPADTVKGQTGQQRVSAL